MSGSNARSAKSGLYAKRGTFSRLMMTSALVAVSFASHAVAADYTLPVNGNIVGGSATITQTAIDKLRINQASDRVVINWDSFNIGKDATVRFNQPTTSSLAVNRVVGAGTDPTRILGTLRANGQVMVLDRNGIIFGNNSIIDVGGLIASTGDVSTTSVMSGASILTLSDFGTGEIVNHGEITVADSGLVAFVGPVVKNNGIITAKLGRVALAAGNETATVDLYGDGLVELAYTDKDDALLAKNSGEIVAKGGTIQMTAAAAKDVVDSVVNMDGIANANSASVVDGKIILSAKKVKITGDATVKGNTTITAKTADINKTIQGDVTGAVDTVNIISDKAKINQGLAIVNAGGKVNVGAGTYDEDVVISKSGVYLKGAQAGVAGTDAARGVGETIITPHSPGIVVSANNVTVDGLTIDGGNIGIQVDGYNNATLQNNIVKNSGSDGGSYAINNGIYVANTSGSKVLNNLIVNTGDVFSPAGQGSGIVTNNASNLLISGNTIDGAVWDGIKVQYGRNITVSDNTVNDVDRAGIYSTDATNVTVSGNDVTNTGLEGIKFMHGSAFTIADNTLNHIGGDGVSVNYMGGTKTIKNNIIDNTNGNGIHVYFSGNTLVQGNEVGVLGGDRTIYGDDILVENSDFTRIGGNTLTGAKKVGAQVGSGIQLANSSNTSVYGNTIYGTDWDGVKILNGSNVSVTGNTISDIARDGVFAKGTTNTTISSNKIDGVGINGIEVLGVNGTTNISSNIIDNSRKHAISAAYAAGTVDISRNAMSFTGDDAIYVGNSGSTKIAYNKIGTFGGLGSIEGDDIAVENTDNVQILNNRMGGATGDGISVTDSDTVTINTNNISAPQQNGIRVYNANDVTVDNNTVSDADWDGINLTYVSGTVDVSGNDVFNSGDDGISVANYGDYNPLTLTVSGNTVDESAYNGIYLAGLVGDIQVLDNEVTDSTYGDGISVQNVNYDGYYYPSFMVEIVEEAPSEEIINQLIISGNDVFNSGNNGIGLYNVAGTVEVTGNTISGSNYNGVYVGNNSFNDKRSFYSGYYGYTPSIDLLIEDNAISFSGSNGIFLDALNGDIRVLNNDIFDTFEGNGIYARNVNQTIEMMTAMLAQLEEDTDTYPANPGHQLIIDGNTIDASNYNGISLYNTGDLVRISNNQITNSGYDGIYAYNDSDTSFDGYYGGYYGDYYGAMDFAPYEGYYGYYGSSAPIDLYILNNTIENSGSEVVMAKTAIDEGYYGSTANAAIELDIGSQGTATIAGNTMGSDFEYGLLGYSGTIDLTGETNTIHDTAIGMGFYPDAYEYYGDGSDAYFEYLAAKLHLVNDTIGTTAFVDQTDAFVDLGYGAFFAPGYPTRLDGMNATYTLGSQTIAPSVKGSVTSAEYAVLESMLYHYLDSNDRGLFFFPVVDEDGVTIDEKDVFRLYSRFIPSYSGGSLVITGLPNVGAGNAGFTPPNNNFNDISPAAGDEEDQGEVASIAPAAGDEANNAPCWSDAAQSLGQGTAVMYSFGSGASQLLQNAASCGSQAPNGQSL